jgi:hypothetical protein
VRISALIAGCHDKPSRAAFHEHGLGSLYQHAPDSTPMVVWRNSQCHDLPVESIVLIEESDSSADEPDDLHHAVASDERVVAIVVTDRCKAPSHL